MKDVSGFELVLRAQVIAYDEGVGVSWKTVYGEFRKTMGVRPACVLACRALGLLKKLEQSFVETVV